MNFFDENCFKFLNDTQIKQVYTNIIIWCTTIISISMLNDFYCRYMPEDSIYSKEYITFENTTDPVNYFFFYPFLLVFIIHTFKFTDIKPLLILLLSVFVFIWLGFFLTSYCNFI